MEDTTSGRRSWRDREIGPLLETADAGDVLVAAEVSRLARSTFQVLELLQAAADRGVTVHIAKNRMVLDLELPRFGGHLTIWEKGVHNGKESILVSA